MAGAAVAGRSVTTAEGIDGEPGKVDGSVVRFGAGGAISGIEGVCTTAVSRAGVGAAALTGRSRGGCGSTATIAGGKSAGGWLASSAGNRCETEGAAFAGSAGVVAGAGDGGVD